MKQNFIRRLLLLTALLASFSGIGMAQDTSGFVVEDIRLEGLRRFSPGVVFLRLPVEIGDTLLPEQTVEIIDALYETGYFRSVEVLRDGDILVIQVDENPTIAEATVSGADELSEDSLNSMLQSAEIAKSKVYNQSVIDQAAKVIEDVYIEKNFYLVTVESVVSPLPRNRVAVLFNVDEGPRAAINSIDIIGNSDFSNWRLTREMRLETRGLFNFFTDNYYYSEQKLNADLERIRTLYLEEGYLRFKVASQQVEVSEDKKNIAIIIHIEEGGRYAVSDIEFELTGGETLPYDVEEYHQYVEQEIGELYNGRVASQTATDIKQRLRHEGYANAEVHYDSNLNEETNAVTLVYQIIPNNIVYVRTINIVGNELTGDAVIRRELLQFERERYSQEKIDRSRDRVRRLGYFNSVKIETAPIAGNTNEVDLLLTVDELNTGEIRLGAGFRSERGVTFDAGFTNSNIFGTGNDLEVDFSYGRDNVEVNFDFVERYHTQDGVSRHFGVSYGEEDAADDSSQYEIDGFRGVYGYEFPFTDNGRYDLDLVYQNVRVRNAGSLNPVYAKFVEEHGDNFGALLVEGGLTYDTRDASSVPTRGHHIRVDAEASVPLLELKYYHADYLHNFYYTLKRVPTVPVARLKLGYGAGGDYGDGEFPFWRRYLLGGSNTLRGFGADSIGYADDASNRALGGKSRLYGSVEVSAKANFFVFEEQEVYLAPFLDFGAIGKEIGLGSFRASWGLEFRWRSPVGPLRFSYVETLKSKKADDIEKFQFSVGSF